MNDIEEAIEVWKDIKGYEGLYQISNLGRVKSLSRTITVIDNNRIYSKTLKQKILYQELHNKGYLNVTLYKNKKYKTLYVHRLVAEAFIDNYQSKSQVNHIDGNRKHNNVLNLEWVTNQENNQYAFDSGLRKTKKVICINDNKIFDNCKKASEHYEINCKMIHACCTKERKTTKGMVFEYLTINPKCGRKLGEENG